MFPPPHHASIFVAPANANRHTKSTMAFGRMIELTKRGQGTSPTTIIFVIEVASQSRLSLARSQQLDAMCCVNRGVATSSQKPSTSDTERLKSVSPSLSSWVNDRRVHSQAGFNMFQHQPLMLLLDCGSLCGAHNLCSGFWHLRVPFNFP